MNDFVEQANLPHKAAKVLLGEKYSNILAKSLVNADVFPIFIPDNPYIDCRLSGHCDLSVVHGGGETLFLAPYLRGSALEHQMSELGADIRFPDITQSEEYPNDAQMNVAIVGNTLLSNEKVSSTHIVNYLTMCKGLKNTGSRQGYLRCSVCIVDEQSIITADKGVAHAATSAGLSVLQISSGYIELQDFKYGFIGGASFKLSDNILAFTGHLEFHPDKERIFSFLKDRNIEPIYLSKQPAFDVGGAAPLIEK